MKMNTKKIILGLSLTLLPLASITTVISCKKKNKKATPKMDLVNAKSLGFNATPGSEKPQALKKNRTKSQSEKYNKQMAKYNADQLAQEQAAVSGETKAKGLGFASKADSEKPTDLTGTPTKSEIVAYNDQMKKYNADQLAQEQAAVSGETQAKGFGFSSTKGSEKPADLTGTPTKSEIVAYNDQMKKYNADQIAQEQAAVLNETKPTELGYDSTEGNKKPVALTGTPTKSEIVAYNDQMAKYNADQIAQEQAAVLNETKPTELGYDSTEGNKKPVALTGTPTKSEIVEYNKQMAKYNADQIAQEQAAVLNETKPTELGYDSTEGNKKPVALTGTPTKSEIVEYNKQMAKYNADQLSQEKAAVLNETPAVELGFTSTEGNKKPIALTGTPTKSEIAEYNAQMKKYNADQLAQEQAAVLNETKPTELGYDSTEGNKKPVALTGTPTKSEIAEYNAQMEKFNADQLVQENIALDGMVKAKELEFTSTQGNEMPAPLTGTPTKSKIDAYNAQMEKYNADQLVQSSKAKSTLISAIDKNFAPTKGMEKPVVIHGLGIILLNKDQIDAYNAQMIKYNKDQFVQNLIIANLNEIDFSKALIKAKNLYFDKPTKGYKKPTHNQYFETLKVNQDDLNEKSILEICDYIKSYNAQMEKYNADQLVQENIALDGIVKAKGLEFTSTQGNEMPAPLTGTPTKSKIDAYNAQMKKYNADQLVQSSKAKSTLISATDKNFTPTKGMEKPAVIHGLGIILLNKDQIDAYNAQMIKYNKDQFVQNLIIANLNEIDFSKALIKAKNLYFDKSTKGYKKPTHNQYFETLKVNQDDLNEKSILEIYDYIKSYNAQMKKFNANQSFLSSIAKERVIKSLLKGQNLIKAKYLGFVSTEGNENPFALMKEFLGHNPTASEIKERMAYLAMEKVDYNSQMKKYNADQLAQLTEKKINEIISSLKVTTSTNEIY